MNFTVRRKEAEKIANENLRIARRIAEKHANLLKTSLDKE